ncbi:MAG TPA: branched-chain amino acid ABC transporter permease [Ramlibacter sp.]|nr:branched-chain amino acid ABC transporter permease [Ramlibacter sp.]
MHVCWLALIPIGLIAFALASPSDFHLNFAIRILIAAIFALSLNLMVGYGGLMSIGHSSFFGIAAYAVAWLSVKQGWGAPAAVATALLLCTAVAGVFALLALRAKGIGFLMITLALGQIVWGVAVRWTDLTGGDNGIRGIKRPQIAGMALDNATAFYALTVVVFIVVCLAMWRITRSPFGASLRGTRDQPRRMSALGFNVWLIQWMAFCLAGFFAGVAGILDLYHHKFVSPEVLSLSASAQALLMVIVGGSSVLLGPVVGAVVVLLFSQIVSAYMDRWTAALGVMFLLIVLFMPEGLVPGLKKWRGKLRWPKSRRLAALAAPAEAPAINGQVAP